MSDKRLGDIAQAVARKILAGFCKQSAREARQPDYGFHEGHVTEVARQIIAAVKSAEVT